MKSLSSFLQPLVLRIGSSKAVVMTTSKKIIFEEPARVATSLATGKILAFGSAALDLASLGAPDVQVSPLFRDGVPVDMELCREYLLWMRASFTTTRLRHVLPYPVICVVPVGFPKPYKQLYESSLRFAHFFPLQATEAVLGDAWMELGESTQEERTIVIRIGATQTQIAAIGNGMVLSHATLAVGGENLDRQLVRYVRRTYEMSLPVSQSILVKEAYTKAIFGKTPFSAVVRGKHVKSSDVRSVTLGQQDLFPIYTHFFESLAASVFETMVRTLHYTGNQSHTTILVSGGLSLFPEAKQSLEAIIQQKVTLVSRPTVASLLGIVSKMT